MEALSSTNIRHQIKPAHKTQIKRYKARHNQTQIVTLCHVTGADKREQTTGSVTFPPFSNFLASRADHSVGTEGPAKPAQETSNCRLTNLAMIKTGNLINYQQF